MISDKIKILLIKRKMTMQELAYKLDTSPQNLSNKISRDNFSEKELLTIARELGCNLDITFTISETGERI